MPDPSPLTPRPPLGDSIVLVVGAGRMGATLAGALRAAGLDVRGPASRGATGAGADVVLLAVPDAEIPVAARGIAPGPLVGHVSGATGLDPLRPHEAFSLHPLTSVTGSGRSLAGAHAAIDGSTPRALAAAEELAVTLGLEVFRVDAADRPAYHAAASIAANFLVTLEGLAERLAATAGVRRAALVPLVRAAVENWAARGAAGALTGPLVRGDEETVARQRAALEARLPEDLAFFDALVQATRELAASVGAGAEAVAVPAPDVDPAPGAADPAVSPPPGPVGPPVDEASP